jgi:hypothetical protein
MKNLIIINPNICVSQEVPIGELIRGIIIVQHVADIKEKIIKN